jgi:hypothetical protein
MPPGNYGFSRKFAWLSDRYGVSTSSTTRASRPERILVCRKMESRFGPCGAAPPVPCGLVGGEVAADLLPHS